MWIKNFFMESMVNLSFNMCVINIVTRCEKSFYFVRLHFKNIHFGGSLSGQNSTLKHDEGFFGLPGIFFEAVTIKNASLNGGRHRFGSRCSIATQHGTFFHNNVAYELLQKVSFYDPFGT
jgi:hypothetical protein